MKGDAQPGRRKVTRSVQRNADWGHLFNRDIISMPDKWESPWYAAWDSAFHMIPFANLDPHFAKEQAIQFLWEWYMHPNGQSIPLRIRSIVGLIPLLTADVLYERVIEQLPGFRKRMQWFLSHRPDLAEFMTYMESRSPDDAGSGLRLLAIPTRHRHERMLRYLLDENEFLSPHGVRSLSKYHAAHPFEFQLNGENLRVQYLPGESDSGLFGGNSNWRGPIWFPLNYLIIEALERYHQFYGDSLRVECPTRSGRDMNLQQVADDLRARLAKLFLADADGNRPCYVRGNRFVNDPHWRDLILFYEYFHADTGRGLGASHQTGWTALIAPILKTLAARRQALPQ
ncbi:MAG: hypothetical protein AB7U20_07280 [Planctomycetaceae bacterium]